MSAATETDMPPRSYGECYSEI